MQAVYLNHAGTSWPKPRPVTEAVLAAWRSDPLDWGKQFEKAHRRIADFFHIPNTNELLLTPGCTSALNIGISDHFWNAGDRALTSGFEHHALHRPLAKLVDQGVEVEVLPHLPHEPIILEALEDSLKQGRVKLVAVTAASNVTGDLMPLEEIIELSHQYEAKVLIDAAQIAGWWDLNLPALGADLVTFAGHKGPQAPWGVGGLYVASGTKMNSPAAVCEIVYDKNSGKPKPPHTGPGWCDGGSVDRSALAGLAAGVEWLSSTARQNRLAYARTLSQQLYAAAADLPNVRLLGAHEMNYRMPTVALTIKGVDSIPAASMFYDRGIVVAGGMQCAPLAHKSLETAPEGVVRFSVGPTSKQDDIEQAIDALTIVARAS